MENTPRLYDTLVAVLSQHRNWLDLRHLKTLAWMMVGLLQSRTISLPEWVPFVHSRAEYAQSTVRRFRRWLDNKRIQVHELYGPLIQQALAEWGENVLYLALDTSMLWNKYCIIRISVVYRGRAVPLVCAERPQELDRADCRGGGLRGGCALVALVRRQSRSSPSLSVHRPVATGAGRGGRRRV